MLLNTLPDYSEPGVPMTVTDSKSVTRLERQMAAKGVPQGRRMAATIGILRANDLIFSYVVPNWLMGQDPPAFEILVWNGDSTRVPAAMHSFCLRSLYMRNELVRGELELAGVRNDTYVAGTINDHIVPWHGSYKTGALMGGTVRYVLSSGGHIAGIVNPPGPKAWYEAAVYAGPDPRGLARFGHQAPRLVAGGPDDVARSRDRRRRKAASHGQRTAPGHRGCHGRVRARLIQVRQTGSIGGTPWVT